MKKFLLVATLLVATLTVSAQEYNWAAGFRFGGFNGLTFKQNKGANALELGASWGIGDYLTVDGVYLWQQPVIGEGFTLYYGAGVYVGLYANDFALGVEGVVGLEYKITNLPLAISLDYRPGLNVLPGLNFNPVNFGLGVKYCF